MNKTDLVINNGNIFLISDISGDVGIEQYHGLFSADVRHLSKLVLRVDGNPIEILASEATGFGAATIVGSNRGPDGLPGDLTVIRRRSITEIFHEDIEVINHNPESRQVDLELSFGADFADIFEIKSLTHEGVQEYTRPRSVDVRFSRRNNQLVFAYARDAFRRTTVVHFNDHVIANGTLVQRHAALGPNARTTFSFSVAFLVGKKTMTVGKIRKIREKTETLRQRLWPGLRLVSDWHEFERTFARSLTDLAALRIYQQATTGKTTSLPAAGLPWFVAVFGRDSLITAYQSLVLGSELATSTLTFLAKYQGKEVNPLRDEQPGKILHEMRFGEVAYFRDWVLFPYYGSADSTPLFLILLSEAYRFGVKLSFIKRMKESALRALAWIDKYGDLDGDGFVEYQKLSERGLDNQNWRDSSDSMLFSSGRRAEVPIASADVQGYVYDAKVRLAEIAQDIWNDSVLADRLLSEAASLKQQFNKTFWLPNRGYFAMGLDKDKKPIDSLSSVLGHLLWSGIVDDEKIPRTVQLLRSASLYSGWGVRTMSAEDIGFNPVVYHRGTVWPHDNSLIAAGLVRSGYGQQAVQIIEDMVVASSHFEYRLPEVFAGFSRKDIPFPVRYPTAASPQAWSAAAPILFLRLLLGIEPDLENKTILLNPQLPRGVEELSVQGISAFGKNFSVRATQNSARAFSSS